MLEDHLDSPVTRRRLRAGPAAAHVDAFADRLCARGFSPTSISSRLRSLARWTDWMRRVGLGPADLVAGSERYRKYMARTKQLRYASGSLHHSVVAASMLIRDLREQGLLAADAAPHSLMDRHPALAEFRAWMVRHRGVTLTTLEVYERTVVAMLDALGAATHAWTAAAVRAFVLERATGYGIARAQSIATAARAFLRFLAATTHARAGLEHCIPGFADRRQSTIPRYLEPEELEQVIAACSPESAAGARDRAVILLLARLGLRAGDVAGLTFGDVDWRNGRLAVKGKSRRQEWLPLPQELGDALLHYLETARPALPTDRVFTTILAPLRPLSRAAVTHVVRSALRRAGIEALSRGAHLLRHSAATAMLRKGASLAGVGAVLRHRSPSTTAHYAKVDFDLLREVAQPWPEVSSC